jgi:hypothetical protein
LASDVIYFEETADPLFVTARALLIGHHNEHSNMLHMKHMHKHDDDDWKGNKQLVTPNNISTSASTIASICIDLTMPPPPALVAPPSATPRVLPSIMIMARAHRKTEIEMAITFAAAR